MDALIHAAYRQVFHEQQMLAAHRQVALESQLRSGQITVKEFMRGLVTSDTFRRLNFDPNPNTRFVELLIQRLLGRNPYNHQEKMAWSIVLGTNGVSGVVDALLNSAEYRENFGDATVPYQRRRILPQRTQGDLPFERMARYGTHYRDQLPQPTLRPASSERFQELFTQFEPFNWNTFRDRANWPIVAGLTIVGTALLVALLAISTSAQG
jgi:phycobilisome rod-core linker protein